MWRHTTVLLIALVVLLYAAAGWLAWRRPLAAASLPRRATGYRIPVNHADADTLTLLPGIGPNLAVRIVTHRARHGPFTSLDQLPNVSGIGVKTQRRLAPLIHLGGDPGGAGRR